MSSNDDHNNALINVRVLKESRQNIYKIKSDLPSRYRQLVRKDITTCQADCMVYTKIFLRTQHNVWWNVYSQGLLMSCRI